MDYAWQRYNQWLTSASIDLDTKAELEAIKNNEEEINERFGRQLVFGTGGLRGIVGAGLNRMNIYTVGLATQAYAIFLRKHGLGDRGVVLSCDSRNSSKAFLQEAAAVLIGNDIPVFVYQRISPTPLLSFGVRHCQADGGIMITASHNPAEYNGYKAYCSKGIQLLPEPSNEISLIMEGLVLEDIKRVEQPTEHPLWNWLDEEVYQAYYRQVEKLAPARDDQDLTVSVLYTPLHGTGGGFVPQVLKNAGFVNVDYVQEQLEPDGNFPTVTVPNPEEISAFDLALQYTKQKQYDLVIATDPDADRVGVVVWTGEQYVLLSGNQVGVLLADYLLQTLPQERLTNGFMIKTVVSTEMVVPIAKDYGVEVFDTLTGFKYIGAQIEALQQQGKNFIFGFEESCGYLTGDFVRDKDAVLASLLIVQMAAYYKAQGKTLLQRLEELMIKYGFYVERLHSYSFASASDVERVANFIEQLRQKRLTDIGGFPIKTFKDYLNGLAFDLETGIELALEFPKENVLQWETKVGDRITLRPSGTEPKMKLYLAIVESSYDSAIAKLELLEAASNAMIDQGLSLK